ncbi:antA/AntB antirepressor family protein [Brassicibacter mesophilus]|uniref:antA/AntB antirepressor family protein n=1 Tax=Brassicibacter mesophilus TaxID=745119 RepID=UPI003D25F4D0
MNELIKINYQGDRQTASARDLWGFLDRPHGEFMKWFGRYADYGFIENVDYRAYRQISRHANGRDYEATDYEITIDMAKELAMLQKTEKGKIARQYFIELEKKWNSPESVMARALQIANVKLIEHQNKVIELQSELEYKTEVIKGITEDIDVYTKRNVLNKVVRHKKANYSLRWNELYDRFREVYSIDLKARCEGYNLKQEKKKDKLSVIKYAEKFGHLDDLYKIAAKLYEADVKEILEQLQKIAM